ncbi:hypothetical protein HUT16_28680 [Kitasatospora sp. NA04385]|uniref:WXG100 family type VII secretion target n=1 Tax=Kitasatospora sp. NA04385 TaxID=2742135 RepID=UPI0015916D69|nr:hypothetical protein [Kitasatospora sp. NA04385]QKW22527.1 hypothetical protein HUT16_28680 [Kitasatospora sp. NA04385]
MSNDEQAPYVEAARIEPDREVHRVPVAPVEPEPFRVGTAVPDSIPAQPVQPVQPFESAMQPVQSFERAAEPLRPQQRMGAPVEPFESAAEPLQPFERAAEPLRPQQRMGTPVEPFERASEPLRPQQRMGTPVEPFERASEPLQPQQRERAAEPTGQAAQKVAARTAASGSGGSGGAGTGFKVDPDQYRAAVSPMLAAAEQVASLYRSLNAYLPSLEAQNPWGNDESGKKFAEGDKGYLKCSESTMALLKSLPDGLKGIADGLKRMAESYQNADENTVAELGGIESTAQMPVAPSLPSSPVHVPITPGMTQSGRH